MELRAENVSAQPDLDASPSTTLDTGQHRVFRPRDLVPTLGRHAGGRAAFHDLVNHRQGRHRIGLTCRSDQPSRFVVDRGGVINRTNSRCNTTPGAVVGVTMRDHVFSSAFGLFYRSPQFVIRELRHPNGVTR